MDTKKKVTVAFLAILIILLLIAMPFVFNDISTDEEAFKTVVVEATEENVQKVEVETNVTAQDVQVEKVDPSVSEKIATKLHTPRETLIFFGSIIVVVLVLLLITILFSVRKSKKD